MSPTWYFHVPMRRRLYESSEDVNSKSEWVETAPKLKIENVGDTFLFVWGRISDTLNATNLQPLGFDWIFSEQQISWCTHNDVPKLNYPREFGKTARIKMYDRTIGGYRTKDPAIVVFPLWDLLMTSPVPGLPNTGDLYNQFIGIHESKKRKKIN